MFVSIVAGLGLLVLAIIDWRAFLTWVGQYNIGGLDANVEFAGPGHLLAIEYLQRNWPLVWLATAGTALLCIRRHGHRGLAVTSAWFVATAVTLAMWSPVWEHYMLFLALPLVAAAGGGLATSGEWVIRTLRGKHSMTWGRAVLAALAFVGAAAFLVDRCRESMPQPEGGPEWAPHQLAAQAFLESAAPPGSFVVADDPLLAFVAGQLVPPRLTGASFKQIRLGYLTADDLVISTLRHEAQAALFATGRLALVQPFERWIAAIATEQRDFGPLRGYRLDLPPSIPHAKDSHLGSGIALEGYSLSSEELQPGNVLTVTLFWRPVRPVTEDYTVFVHLMDEANHLWDQHDGPPLMEAHSTSRWTEGMLLPDPHPILVSPETPPGTYRLSVGMYRWPSLKRLPAFRPDGSRWRNDRLVLTELRLTAPRIEDP
ncbi:MAG: hypothetical protein GWN58_64340 [Anaerolineae bacterium]|nr:hypothetical protein [Anaerolineae bacterium]